MKRIEKLRYQRRQILGCLLLAVPLSGCVARMPTNDGTTHYIILGFGIVSVGRSPEDTVQATRMTAVGLSVSDQPLLKLGLGYASATVVTVPQGARDVRMEVSSLPWGPFIVDTQSVVLGE